jgi:hypothetical protein
MPLLEFGFAVLGFHGGEFALQNLDKEIAAAERRLQKARVDAFGLAFHKIKYGRDQPRRRKQLTMVRDTLLGPN